MREETIDAIKVQKGQTVTRVVTNEKSRWRKRPVQVDQDVRKTRGRWPTVTRAEYRRNGEGGRTTVYLETSDSPGWVFCLYPDDQVTVEVAWAVPKCSECWDVGEWTEYRDGAKGVIVRCTCRAGQS